MNNKKRSLMARAAMILALPAIILLLLLIFHVRTVDVSGNVHHTKEQIVEDLGSGFLDSNTLYLMWKYRKKDPAESIPYLNSIAIDMKSPGHISVKVVEKELAGCVDKGDYVYFDTDGIVQEITPERYEEVPLITGAGVEEPVLYQKLPTASSAQLRTILSITALLTTKQDASDRLQAKEIIFGDNNDITVKLKGGLTAMIGQDEYLEEKIANLRAICKTMEDNLSGVLHLESVNGSKEGLISFTPGDESDIFEPESGTEGDGSTDEVGSEDGISVGDDFVVDDPRDGEPVEYENYVVIDMVFNSYGTLVYNVHVENGIVVDQYGSEVPGCYVNEDGNIVDAYMNVFSGVTGSNITS